MATPFDRAAKRYIEEWVPRFVPYHLDLVRELALAEGQRVYVASCGPGAEVLAVARAVGDRGVVRATDASQEMVDLCDGQVKKAAFAQVRCEKAAPGDVGEGGWDAIVCAFGLWVVDDRAAVLADWAKSLAPNGKVGVLTFGPPDDTDAFELLSRALTELEPGAVGRPPRIDAGREAITRMFEGAGLAVVRHTVLRHTVSFATAEDFVAAIREGRTWRAVFEGLGPERAGRVTARFFEQVGGPTAPLVFAPAATLAIAAHPGAEVELAVRPSVVAPPLSTAPHDGAENADD
ncbi:MAG: methyltransferase domain-containing protein [Labilithrix sp.]|nr:methyltransferase domain-containing protein [Labilithrix sp.]